MATRETPEKPIDNHIAGEEEFEGFDRGLSDSSSFLPDAGALAAARTRAAIAAAEKQAIDLCRTLDSPGSIVYGAYEGTKSASVTSPRAKLQPMEFRDGGSTWSNAWHHFRTISHHKWLVFGHCRKVGLFKQGLLHDLSKYSPTEFGVGVKYYQGNKSPNTAERAALGYSLAWLHHKGRNKHHFEYWIDMRGNGDPSYEGKPMPTRYVIEMFCDRMAASKVYKGADYTDSSALEYFYLEQSLGTQMMHADAANLLERMLIMLACEGEKSTFRAIKHNLVKPRYTQGMHGAF